MCCVTECGTNERTDYSLKPRVIISSPRIKRQIEPTHGAGRSGPRRCLFLHRKSRKSVRIKGRKEMSASYSLQSKTMESDD